MVLLPAEFKVSRSLRKRLRAASRDAGLQVRLDGAFDQVMRACAAPRQGRDGTWITEEIVAAYGALHRLGLAHSVEVRSDGMLIGGLYGVSIGRMFYGESMFARVADASKIALSALVQILLEEEIPVIDCQQNTRHLGSLGAREITREEFCSHIAWATTQPAPLWERWDPERVTATLSRYDTTASIGLQGT
jgi:leucyl/phenylalanyl-tRNA--protein transferase